MSKAVSAPEDDRKLTPLGPNGLRVAETVRNVYRIAPPDGSKPDDLLKPDFWVHVSRLMRLGDKIEVLASDWYAEATVMEVGERGYGGARVAFTYGPVSLKNEASIPEQNDFDVRWGGPNGGWQVVRIADSTVVKGHLDSKSAGNRWVESHMRALAA